jgi:uncharacterized protein
MDIQQLFSKGTFKIIVKPSMPKTEIKEWDEERGALRVNVHGKAEENKANIEIVKFFTRQTKKKARIVSGRTSKEKLIRLE